MEDLRIHGSEYSKGYGQGVKDVILHLQRVYDMAETGKRLPALEAAIELFALNFQVELSDKKTDSST